MCIFVATGSIALVRFSKGSMTPKKVQNHCVLVGRLVTLLGRGLA